MHIRCTANSFTMIMLENLLICTMFFFAKEDVLPTPLLTLPQESKSAEQKQEEYGHYKHKHHAHQVTRPTARTTRVSTGHFDHQASEPQGGTLAVSEVSEEDEPDEGSRAGTPSYPTTWLEGMQMCRRNGHGT